MREALQALVDSDVMRFPSMPGRMMCVLAPDIDVEVAAGVNDWHSGLPLATGARFRIASVTKTFVAAATLRLVEEGRLDLDREIIDLIAPQSVSLLVAGGYDPTLITTRHLLSHTSGVFDFAADAYDLPLTQDGFYAAIRAEPRRRWSREDQLRFAVERGAPYGPPGSVFAYSDTGTNLVGEIIERSTNFSLGVALRELVDYSTLGLSATYLESVEPEPTVARAAAGQYEGDFDIWQYDASVDLWGGGGLVSTCHDLAVFFRALCGGRVLHTESALRTMLTPPVLADGSTPTTARGTPGMFLFRTIHRDVEVWGHGGYWGTYVATAPSLDLTIATQHGQAWMPDGFDSRTIVRDVLDLFLGAA